VKRLIRIAAVALPVIVISVSCTAGTPSGQSPPVPSDLPFANARSAEVEICDAVIALEAALADQGEAGPAKRALDEAIRRATGSLPDAGFALREASIRYASLLETSLATGEPSLVGEQRELVVQSCADAGVAMSDSQDPPNAPPVPTLAPEPNPTSEPTPTPRPNVWERVFIDALHIQFPLLDAELDAALLDLGYTICDQVDEGVSAEQLAVTMASTPLALPGLGGAVMAGASVLCKEHSAELLRLFG